MTVYFTNMTLFASLLRFHSPFFFLSWKPAYC